MGVRFRLEHANIMAYLSSRWHVAPRVRATHLSEFFDVLIYEPYSYLIYESGREFWPEEMSEIALQAKERLLKSKYRPKDQSKYSLDDVVPSFMVKRLLDELRSEFSDYSVFALAVGNSLGLREKAEDIARLPLYRSLLVLIPEDYDRETNLNVIDPIPAFSTGLHAAADWPGFVFWTLNGVNAYASLETVDELISEIKRAIRNSPRIRRKPFPEFSDLADIDWVLQKWGANRPSNSRRLLHLSDLHFGTYHATQNQAMLDAELRDVVRSVDRVVITGDLFDTPDKNYATLFTTFRNNITHLSGGKEPISITGNHDQRLKGIWGADYEHVARIGPTRIEVDDDCHMIFICFNSSEGGVLARGQISDSQFRSLGAEYRNLLASRQELKDYLPIVLVHHHPFSFKASPEGWLEQTLAAFGLSLERTLVLKNPEKLHNWCVDWNIKTILHGHKHKARYVERNIKHSRAQIQLTAIGCGSSLGAEGSPMSYNLLEWNSAKQKWVAAFYESINGGAFRELAVSVSH